MNNIGETPSQYLKRATLGVLGSIVEGLSDLGAAIVGIVAALVVLPTIPFALLYFLFIKGHSNCLLYAIYLRLRNWRTTEVICKRNAGGRLHWAVRVKATGAVYAWYAEGASQRSYLRNLWYKGCIRLEPSK